ncbi:MAG TPA: BolA/IbaG family iron-sulfur metabolism protein [Polyangiaceae bacterium]|nr:BolA/IbaG family iron-sulfur metabolism protein [Polyangiaceae bacterium]
MSAHPTNFQGDVVAALRQAIESKIPSSQASVSGAGGHYTIEVVSSTFEGLSMLESQRLVYSAVAHLMQGDLAPVHAVDKLTTRKS